LTTPFQNDYGYDDDDVVVVVVAENVCHEEIRNPGCYEEIRNPKGSRKQHDFF
jgi:hypothetical protein